MNNIQEISTANLKPDMILAKNFKQNNVNLLNKGTVLTDVLIKKIQQLYPLSVMSIYKDEQDQELSELLEKNAKKIAEVEKVFIKFADNMDKLLKKIHQTSKPDINDLRSMSKNIIEQFTDYSIVLKSILNERSVDEYLVRHSVNVAVLSSMLGKWLNLSEKDLMLLTYAGLLHDIGKAKIDSKILNKPSRLTKQEFEIIKKHSVIGYQIIKTLPYIHQSVGIGVLMHHERIDGSGYPLSLKDDQIHIFGKILSIADTFDALTSNRAYAKKCSPFKALEIMQHEEVGKYDIRYLNVFVNKMCNFYTGEFVKLNNGKIGKIIKIDINNISNPLIMIDSDFVDLKNEKSMFIEDLI